MLTIGLFIGIPIVLLAGALAPAALLQWFLGVAGQLEEEAESVSRESATSAPALVKV
jgi:hypothetical protein